jgi:uncharacterized protein with HEPN domain
MSSKDEAQRLRDIIQNIDNAVDYVGARNHTVFAADQKTVDAVERCIDRIAEAMIKIGVDRMAEIAPDISFPGVRQLGNIMRHEYDVVDTRLVFAMVVDRMPRLRAACAVTLAGS